MEHHVYRYRKSPSTDRRMEYINTLIDYFSKYSILILSKDHMALTVSNALLDWVIPCFGVPRRLLSDRGWKFVGQVWKKLLKALGIQWVFTSPYQPEGNAINEQSHRTMLYDNTPAPHWVDRIPAIMLTVNSMPHQPHGYSASMIATGHENALPHNLVTEAQFSEGKDALSAYVSAILERLWDVLQQVARAKEPTQPNPYRPRDLIWIFSPFREYFKAYTSIDGAFSDDQSSQSIPRVLLYWP